MTRGVVSTVPLDLPRVPLALMQIDVPVNAGLAGGPLLSGGSAVGIIAMGVEGAEGIGVAIPANYASQIESLGAGALRNETFTAWLSRAGGFGGPDAAAKSLSGGNLQKFIVGREIDARPRLLIVSQPTWGVDVGAAAQIRAELLALRDEGCAVLVVSEELEELFEVCDRLHVIAKGRLSPAVERSRASVTQIGEWMSGLWTAEEGKAHAQV